MSLRGIMELLQDLFVLLGRVCMGAMFIWGAYEKITHWQATESYMKSKHVPQLKIVLPAMIALELIGGFSALLGWHAHFGALLLLIAMAPSVVWFHPFWKANGLEKTEQRISFMKEVSIVGGLLLLLSIGAGHWAFS